MQLMYQKKLYKFLMVLKMKNKIAIIANGSINNSNFLTNYTDDADIVICADGGANTARDYNIRPDYIIGDMDSIKSTVLHDFTDEGNTKIIKDTNEEKTDLELALSLAETLDPNEIVILGAIGDRIDHTLANIMCLNYIKPEIKAKIIDEKNIIELVENSIEIQGDEDNIVSVVPLTDVAGLSYNGLKWLVNDKNTKFGWFGISNRLSENKANISLKQGKILVIRANE